jgi:polysaccharide pyruvyl transferase WcaK-like protein
LVWTTQDQLITLKRYFRLSKGPSGMSHPSQKLRIGLLWHSMNSDNLGVGALTLANIDILEDVARRAGLSAQFVVLGWSDAKPAYLQRDNIEVVGLRMLDFVRPVGGLYGRLRGCDVVLDIGAGDSFADIYGMKRFGTMLASKMLALAARRPLVLSPQTIGPFNRPWVRMAALAVMNRADAVATRDDLSTEFLRKIGYRKAIIEASDVALRLPYHAATRAPGARVRVGLNVSGLLFNGGYTRDNMFGLRSPYAGLVHALLQRLTARDDLEIHLVAHVISDRSEVEDDHRANLKLAADFPDVVLAPKFRDPIEAKSYISGLDFFAGARMHACIAAFSCGVPVLPMAYSRKFAGMFGSLGYDVLADCRTETAEEILARFEDALARRAEIKDVMQACLRRGLARLQHYENAVSVCLESAARR